MTRTEITTHKDNINYNQTTTLTLLWLIPLIQIVALLISQKYHTLIPNMFLYMSLFLSVLLWLGKKFIENKHLNFLVKSVSIILVFFISNQLVLYRLFVASNVEGSLQTSILMTNISFAFLQWGLTILIILMSLSVSTSQNIETLAFMMASNFIFYCSLELMVTLLSPIMTTGIIGMSGGISGLIGILIFRRENLQTIMIKLEPKITTSFGKTARFMGLFFCFILLFLLSL